MKKILVATLLLLATTAHAEVKKGDHFVELDAKAKNGKTFRLKDMAGKWVLFGFNASWCGPCKKELPALDRIAPKLAGKVLFVAVNIDSDADDGHAFIDSLKLRKIFPVFMNDENSAAMKAYDPDRMPSLFVIDPKGTVQLVEYGYNKGDEDRLCAKLLDLTK
ncbi:MAG TPA: TlpA disulfide reductase family protein [Kofleriaceae bacterium]|jgi:thiol-disulfide isomerase/thioredoxin|nr:TlpA disulfide reductase family protein [Kofleriaceae bacterium]